MSFRASRAVVGFKQSLFPSYKSLTQLFPKTFSSTGAKCGESDEILFETKGDTGIILLNRPKALNSLSLSMTKKIRPQLKAWESTQKLIIVKATGGKAFCAGGDARKVAESILAGNNLYRDIFRDAYKLFALVGTLRIPYISLLDGLVMGAGFGLSGNGKFTVATERAEFGVPEPRLGFFPDAGASYILPRLEGKLGLYLALTGFRLKGSDLYRAGIFTHFCNSQKLDALEHSLISLKSPDLKDVEEVLQGYHAESLKTSPKEFILKNHMDKINKVFSAPSIEEIIEHLRQDNSDWAKATIGSISQMSPTSLKITMKLLQLGGRMNLQEALCMDFRLSQYVCKGHDCVEGVRALLVEKDNTPKWKPATLAEVTQEAVDSHFAPLPENEELNL